MRAFAHVIIKENPGAPSRATGAMKVPNDGLPTESSGLLQAIT